MIDNSEHKSAVTFKLSDGVLERMRKYCKLHRIKLWGFVEDAIIDALKRVKA